MQCIKCNIEAPSNLSIINSSEWVCENCASNTRTVLRYLSDEYKRGIPGRFVYISELTNNLDKVQQLFRAEMDMNNPFCTVVLTSPIGMGMLRGKFDTVFVDKDSVPAELIGLISLEDFGKIYWVDPVTQQILE